MFLRRRSTDTLLLPVALAAGDVSSVTLLPLHSRADSQKDLLLPNAFEFSHQVTAPTASRPPARLEPGLLCQSAIFAHGLAVQSQAR